jgi:hypothetical protein
VLFLFSTRVPGLQRSNTWWIYRIPKYQPRRGNSRCNKKDSEKPMRLVDTAQSATGAKNILGWGVKRRDLAGSAIGSTG